MSKKALNTFWVVCQCLVLIIVTGLAGGCNDDDNSKPQTVQGWVSAGTSPISAANLEIDNLEGKPIYQNDEPVTTPTGSFLIDVHNLPADFRIVASNGYYLDQPFLADLSADYRNFDPEVDSVEINVVTTMVSAYLDKHPEATLDEATLTVMNFLEIPEGVDIRSGLSASGEYFDHYRFLQEAANNGGVNPYIDQLMAEMDGGAADVTHPFLSSGGAGGGMLGGFGDFIFRNLASGAASYVGGQAFGYGLREIGLTFPGSPDPAAITKMAADIQSLKTKFDGLESSLHALDLNVTQADYSDGMRSIILFKSAMKDIKNDLATLYSSDWTGKQAQLEALKKSIKGEIEREIKPNQYIIHYLLVGEGNSDSLLKLWSQIIKGQHRFLSARDYPKIKAQFDYFELLQAWQLEIMTEYYRTELPPGSHDPTVLWCNKEEDPNCTPELVGDPAGNIQRIQNEYKAHIAEQEKLLLKPVPDQALIDRDQKLMIYEGDYFNWQNPDGTPVSSKAPMYGNWLAAINNVNNMNQKQYLGFNNWRKMGGAEIDDLIKLSPNNPRQYLQDQGWAAPVPHGMYFANPGVVDGTSWGECLDYNYSAHLCDEQVQITNFRYYALDVDNGGWYEIIDYSYTTLRWRKVAWFDIGNTTGQFPKLNYHWIMVRTMDANELNQYFW